jgi:hypothetical protein
MMKYSNAAFFKIFDEIEKKFLRCVEMNPMPSVCKGGNAFAQLKIRKACDNPEFGNAS